MAANLNRVILIGNLTADPDLSYTGSGTARAKFRIAVNRQYKDASGQLKEETAYIPIVTWGAQAENCANYLRKGRSVAVEGRLRVYSFNDEEGREVRWFEIVAQNVQFLGGPRSPADGYDQSPPDRPANDTDRGVNNGPSTVEKEPEGKTDEEVPF